MSRRGSSLARRTRKTLFRRGGVREARGQEAAPVIRSGVGQVSILISRFAAARIYVRPGQRTIEPAVFQLAAAGVDLFAGQRTDQAGLG